MTTTTAATADETLAGKADALATRLEEIGSVLVAFSGGADSALLLAAAVRTLGTDRVAAATAVSASLPESERGPALAFSSSLGVRHLWPATDEMSRDGYRANAGDRCYFCKAELLDVLWPVAAELGLDHVATGTNADDAIAGFRPGIRAALERGAVSPLRDADFSKVEVRALSRAWELPTWDKPAAACLSSRVAYGISITPTRLARVERAEAELRATFARLDLPVANLRVRDLGEAAEPASPSGWTGERARIEVDADFAERAAAMPEVSAAVRSAGFDDVEVDLRGFRSGSMNEALPTAEPNSFGPGSSAV